LDGVSAIANEANAERSVACEAVRSTGGAPSGHTGGGHTLSEGRDA